MNHFQKRRALFAMPLLLAGLCQAEPEVPTEKHGPAGDAPKRLALLVGINDYSASDRTGTTPAEEDRSRGWQNLSGAVHDVEAMRDMLIGRYAFLRQDIRLLTNREAKREAILAALRDLGDQTDRNDVVVFQYSGHGSYQRNRASKEPDGLDETIVPADSARGAPDIRDKELRVLFNRILDRDARLFLIIDSCHSGSVSRGLFSTAPLRGLRPALLETSDDTDPGPRPASRGAVVLAASEDDEPAYETRDENGRPHGAFTLALLRAMRSAAPQESAQRVFQRAEAWLGATGRLQHPILEGLPERVREPLFGGRADHHDGATVVAVEPGEKGAVRVRGGWVNGLNVGSTLRRRGGKEKDPTLRITALEGLGRSVATVEPQGSSVAFGELFELVNWVAPAMGPLRVSMPRIPRLDLARDLARDLADIAEQHGIHWVEDPTVDAATHLLRFRDAGFEILRPGAPTIRLGPRPSAAAVAERLGRGARLFVQLPVPASLLDAMELGPGTNHTAVAPASPEQALYVLAGRLRKGEVEYAWIRPGAHGQDSARRTLGRTDWHALPQNGDLTEVAGILEEKILRLAKIQAWLALESPTEGAAYRLRLIENSGREVEGETLHDEGVYRFLLEKTGRAPRRLEDRYVYIFSIDSHGNGVLLFPSRYLGSENRVPGSWMRPGESVPKLIDLTDSAFVVKEPFGVDTYFLLAAPDPILRPAEIFEYEGVLIKGPTDRVGLEKLLAQTGTTQRGSRSMSMTRSWYLERKTFRTVPLQTRSGFHSTPDKNMDRGATICN